MKLSELKPCAVCKGKIIPNWYVVRVSQAIMNRNSANSVLGLAQMFGGVDVPGALKLAETMAPDDEVGVILGDKEPSLMTQLIICQNCFIKGPTDLATLMETQRGTEEESEGAHASTEG